MTSFPVFIYDEYKDDGVRRYDLSPTKGWLIGKDVEEATDIQVSIGQISMSQAVYLRDNSDGYSLTIDVEGSVLSYTEGNVEGLCFQADYAMGVECFGIHHTAEEDVGETWALWVEHEDFESAMASNEPVTGIDISGRWYRQVED